MLLLSINGVILLLMLVTGGSTFYSTHHELDELFDAQLAQYARMVRHLLLEGPKEAINQEPVIEVPRIIEDGIERTSAQERHPEGHKYENKIAVQVWNASGQLLLRSANAGTHPLQPMESGYHVVEFGGFEWVGFSLFAEDLNVWIFTAQREDVRGELSFHVTLDQLVPLSFALIPIFVLVWLAVYWGTNPIRALSAKLADSDPANFTPLDMELPRELQPFQNAVNTLLAELKEYVIKEKRFIADASHELRTPLSILQLHTENLSQATSTAEILEAREAIQRSTKRLSHLVFQLMEMQKLEHLNQLHKKSISLLDVISDAMAQIESRNLDNVNWDIKINKNTLILAEPALFQCVMRNLLDNSAKYAPQGSVVRVELEELTDVYRLIVANQIPADTVPDLVRLGERFFRHTAHQDIEGSGLGLSIVAKIVELHRMNLSYQLLDGKLFIAKLLILKSGL